MPIYSWGGSAGSKETQGKTDICVARCRRRIILRGHARLNKRCDLVLEYQSPARASYS